MKNEMRRRVYEPLKRDLFSCVSNHEVEEVLCDKLEALLTTYSNEREGINTALDEVTGVKTELSMPADIYKEQFKLNKGVRRFLNYASTFHSKHTGIENPTVLEILNIPRSEKRKIMNIGPMCLS